MHLIGIVTPQRQAVIPLQVLGTGGSRGVEAILDTGFTGYMTLPPAVVDELGFSYLNEVGTTLADGSFCVLPLYEGSVDWFGEARKIPVVATGTQSIVGMSLLQGSLVSLHVLDGGEVIITLL
jgi:predicted aspartyl protease